MNPDTPRSVAICFKDALDLSRWMVEKGWAVASRKSSLDYVINEERARMERRNIGLGGFDMLGIIWPETAREKSHGQEP